LIEKRFFFEHHHGTHGKKEWDGGYPMAHEEVSQGVLVECDIPMKQFILHLAQNEPDAVQVVHALREDDTHIFVKDKATVRYVKERVTEDAKALTYTPKEEGEK
jgi:hypothetical protein